MAPKVGDTLPSVPLFLLKSDPIVLPQFLKGKRAVIFGLPGAYTPTCDRKHLPGYLEDYDKIKALGVDHIICVATNDAFVTKAWGDQHKVGDKILILADPLCDWAAGLGEDMYVFFPDLGKRSRRFMMIVDDGVIKSFDLEPSGEFVCSNSASAVKRLTEVFGAK